MFRIYFLIILASSFRIAIAQNIDDAYRYSEYSPAMSARTMGMGATMSAIGVDAASVYNNPAGLGNIRRNEFQISLSNNSYNNESSYFSTYGSALGSKLSLPSINLLLASIKYDQKGKPLKTGLVSGAWQIGVNKLSDYNEEINFSGTNASNSITDYFASYANSFNSILPPSQLINEPGYLDVIAYKAGAIGYNNTTGKYNSAYDSTNSNFIQKGNIARTGNKMAYSVGYGFNIDHSFQFGFNLGIQSIKMNQKLNFKETDIRTVGADKDIESINYYYTYFDKGTGFNLKLGGAVTLAKGVKLGVVYDFPTRYNMKTSFGYDAAVVLDKNASPTISSLRSFTSPFNTNSYYTVTPGIATIALNAVMDKKFMANLEVVSINYARMKMGDTLGPYSADNQEIAVKYANSQIIKLGVEYNHGIPKNKDLTLRLRMGYMHKPSAYKRAGVSNFEPLLKPEYNVMLGTGLISKNWYIDLGVRLASQNTFLLPYNIIGASNPQGVDLKRRRNTVQVTTGFKF